MALTFKGDTTFDDAMEPRAGKSDWGMDTLQRKMKGDYTRLAAFLLTLTQGTGYVYNGVSYYLQSWEPDDDQVFPTVNMIYKGLSRGIPDPVGVDETCINTTSISANIASLGITNSDGTTAQSATRDIEFWSPQTTWRYIKATRPTSPTYSSTANGVEATIIRSVITLDNGTRYTGSAPAGLVTALTIAPSYKVTGPHAEPVIGTPYFECQDVVQRGFWN